MSRRIVVLCPHPEGRAPSQRLKFEQYFPSWRDAGYEVDVRPFWTARTWSFLYAGGHRIRKAIALADGIRRRLRDLRAARRADIVYLHLSAVPIGPPLIERRLHRWGVPVVYDIDDLVYLPHASASNSFMRRLRGPGKPLELMALADEVIVCTDHLAEVARTRNDRVTQISSTIDLDAYTPPVDHAGEGPVVLGWTGSHSTAPYLHLLDGVLRRAQRDLGVRIKVIGDANFSIPGVEVEAQSWERATEVEDLRDIDIGLYPLPDESWVLGKSGLKALQYMALGIPVIATDLGMNRQVISDGQSGVLVIDDDAWLAAIAALATDAEQRREFGRRGRKIVEDRFSVRANVASYLEVLDNAVRHRRDERSGEVTERRS